MFWVAFFPEIITQLCFCLQDFIKIVRLLFATVSMYELTHSCLKQSERTYRIPLNKHTQVSKKSTRRGICNLPNSCTQLLFVLRAWTLCALLLITCLIGRLSDITKNWKLEVIKCLKIGSIYGLWQWKYNQYTVCHGPTCKGKETFMFVGGGS